MEKFMSSLAYPPIPRRGMQSGVHMVELSLTIGFFLLIFFSSVIGVFLVYSYAATTYLAREGVQYAIKRGNDADIATDPAREDAPADLNRIKEYLSKKGVLSPITVDVCWSGAIDKSCTLSNPALVPGTNNKPGMPVRVTVTYTFHPPLAGDLWPHLIEIRSSAQGTILF